MKPLQSPFTSEHFKLHQFAPGVFAAIAVPGGGAYSNAGIIDIGGQTLIFDAFDTPPAAQDLYQAQKEYASNDRVSILLSHHHSDHRIGIQVFPGRFPVISTRKTRQLVYESENNPDYSPEQELLEMGTYRESLLSQLESQKDPRWQTNLKASISHLDKFIDAIPSIKIRFPDQTFEREITFYGSEITAHLVHAGSGHTSSDSYLLFPQQKVAFIGDIGFFECHPYLQDCNPDGLRAILRMLLEMDVETFIPGHGPPGSKKDLVLLVEYLDTLEEIAQRSVAAGVPEQELPEIDIPAPFDRWSFGINRFEPNIRYFCERVAPSQPLDSG